MDKSLLITIPPSHYCEKIRWVLDYSKIPYQEEGHLPLFHRKATGKYKATSVPVFVYKDKILKDSSDILKYIDSQLSDENKLFHLGKEKEIEELENLFDEKLGPHTRRFAYFFLLDYPQILYPMFFINTPKSEEFYFKLGFPVIKFLMKKGMNINKASFQRSKNKIKEVFDEVEKRLSDGRKFLNGDKISAADITFASLSAPVVLPPEYTEVDLEILPPDFRKETEFFKNTIAGEYTLNLYKNFRKLTI